MSGLIYDGRIAPRVKGKVYRMVLRPAMMYDVEIMALAKKTQSRSGGSSFLLGVARLDRISNEFIK